jgi:hypothetical protein
VHLGHKRGSRQLHLEHLLLSLSVLMMLAHHQRRLISYSGQQVLLLARVNAKCLQGGDYGAALDVLADLQAGLAGDPLHGLACFRSAS